jgi:hypothetical protein
MKLWERGGGGKCAGRHAPGGVWSMGVLIFKFHCIPALNISEALKAKGLTW